MELSIKGIPTIKRVKGYSWRWKKRNPGKEGGGKKKGKNERLYDELARR